MMNKNSGKLGLVLSGGGVRGAAHLGVLQFLEELGIKPAVISGTSAGALVGALYASGCSLNDILNFFKNTSIFRLGHFTASKAGFIDADKFRPVLAEYFPEDDFSILTKKLFVTTTDLIHGKVKTFSEGPLIDPLLASAALPVVFSPIQIENLLYTDGGALNNFPTEPLAGQCDAIIGVDVHPLKNVQPVDISSTFRVMERIFHITVHYQAVQKYHICNVVINPQDLARFGTFDRGFFDEIMEIGYQSAREKKEELLRLRKQLSGGE